jgi:hypothetical protein
VAVTAGQRVLSVKDVDLHTFGSGSDYSGDSAYPSSPIEIQRRKGRHERVAALALPPPAPPGEHGGRDGRGRGASCNGGASQTTAGLSARGHCGGGGAKKR